jgi:NAD(P)-dependent dehydrogenase (short-subunit alcohol dehydrogenase family)
LTEEDNLAGKVAIVTGGTSGIGRSICERFTAQGATVCFTGRRADLGAKIADETGTAFYKADNRSEDDLAGVIRTVREAHDRIDILVNNAGDTGPGARIEDIPVEDFDFTIQTHLRGAFLMTKHVIPAMRQAGGGAIVNMCSVAAHRVGGHSHIYSVAKAALIHFTRCTAMELGEYNIRVNSVSPGFIPTEIHMNGSTKGDDAARAKKIDVISNVFQSLQPLPRLGSVDDVSEAVMYLASDRAAFITGSDIVIDGGLSLGRQRLMRPSKT